MRGKRVVVGVTGGIAAYKAAELVRLLVKAEAETRVVMTKNATRFVTPLTFQALSGHRVVWDMWDSGTDPMDHIRWGQEADLMIIAPATADMIGKMAHGIGDDLLSTMILASTSKILVCPSMNDRMFLHPAVTDNLRILQERGCRVMAPAEGELACGTRGPGRLPDPQSILELALLLCTPKDLEGMKLLVTAGPTAEPLDPVRFLTNRSSGKMGFAIARMAQRRGAAVTLVSGPTHLPPPQGVNFIGVGTATEMKETVQEQSKDRDVIVKAAAVSDYRVHKPAKQKIKKSGRSRSLELTPNPDILAELGREKEKQGWILVGFAAETEDLAKHAKEKLEKKNLDVIVANDVSREDAGFQSDHNQVRMIFRDGRVKEIPLMTKDEVADRLLDEVKELWKGNLEQQGKK